MSTEITETENKEVPRRRNPELTKKTILMAAREEFCNKGLDGARINAIAERSGSNKRMIYHYFSNKEGIYKAVLLEAYKEIRKGERELHLTDLSPERAMDKLVRFTFNHFINHPWFIRLLIDENMHQARNLKQIEEIKQLHSPLVSLISGLLNSGAKQGIFKTNVDPLQLYLSIASLGFFYLSNIHTLSFVFDTDLAEKRQLNKREDHIVELILGYLKP